MNSNPIFVIAHKYIKPYQSYIKYYIDNIRAIYSDALIIVVDNNSLRFNEIRESLSDKIYADVVFLVNDTECKYELGAYKVGIQYILDKNLPTDGRYIFFSQDNYILKKKVDLESLYSNNILACPFVNCVPNWRVALNHDDVTSIVKKLNIDYNAAGFCWCSSFLLHSSLLLEFVELVKDIKITNRLASEASERYLGAITYKFNNYKNDSLDGDYYALNYNWWTVNVYDNYPYHFIKHSQQKNDLTAEE